MPRPLLISSQLDYLIWIFDRNSHIYWQTVQIQISWLLQKPTDLDLHCLLWQGMLCSTREELKMVEILYGVSSPLKNWKLYISDMRYTVGKYKLKLPFEPVKNVSSLGICRIWSRVIVTSHNAYVLTVYLDLYFHLRLNPHFIVTHFII